MYGDRLDLLGCVFLAAVDSVEMESIVPQGDWTTKGIDTVILQEFEVDASDSPTPQQWTIGNTKDVTLNWSYTSTYSISFGASVSVKGTFKVVEVTATAKWQVDSGSSTTNGGSTTINLPWHLTGATSPGDKQKITAVTKYGSLDRLPFDCQITLTFKDGQTLTFSDRGRYTEGAYTGFTIVTKTTKPNGIVDVEFLT